MSDDTNTHIHSEDSELNSADSKCTQYDILIYAVNTWQPFCMCSKKLGTVEMACVLSWNHHTWSSRLTQQRDTFFCGCVPSCGGRMLADDGWYGL